MIFAVMRWDEEIDIKGAVRKRWAPGDPAGPLPGCGLVLGRR